MNIALVNGTRLGYWESGRGPKSMLLVHGWGCDHTTLVPLMEHFRQLVSGDRGRPDGPWHQRQAAPGIYGSGFCWRSGAPVPRTTVQNPVVIGHSMGGTIALDLGTRYRDLVSALVLIDSVIISPCLAC